MNKGVLLDAGGRAMGKDKGLAKSEANEQALEISYDPDGLFPEVDESSASMMIDRRLGVRQAEKEKEMEEEMKKEHEEARAKLQEERDARVQPDPEDPEALVKYFFDTEINEMEYEIVRCRPLLVESFFQHLQKTVDESEGLEKEKREALYKVTSGFVGFVDFVVGGSVGGGGHRGGWRRVGCDACDRGRLRRRGRRSRRGRRLH